MKTICSTLAALVLLFVSITPANAQLDDIYNNVKKEIKKIGEDTSSTKTQNTTKKNKVDTAFVSLYHRTHKGEMAFCKDKDPDLSQDIAFETSFSEKDKVTACVYLEKRIDNYKTSGDNGTYNNYFIKSYVDGEEQANPFDDHFRNGDVKAFSVRILGNDGGILTNSNGFGNKVIQMTPGEHKFRFEVYGGSMSGFKTSEPIARGEFTFIKSEKEKEQTHGKFSDVRAGMKDLRLEQQAIDAVNEKASREDWKERYSKATITSYDWETIRNEWTGIITGRAIYMTLYGTWPDGTCRKVDFGFFEDFDGFKYSSVLQYNGIGDMWLIECE